MALSIKEERVGRKVRELARLAATSLTGAVELAVDAELQRRRSARSLSREDVRAVVRGIQDRITASPRRNEHLTDEEIVGYDEDGLPS